jgi:hypothetical protein
VLPVNIQLSVRRPDAEGLVRAPVAQDRFATEQTECRVLLETFDRQRKEARHHPIVGGGEIDVVAGGRFEPAYERRNDALVLFVEQDPNGRRLACEASDHIAAVVGRRIVDHDDLIGLAFLRQQRFQRAGHHAAMVIVGKHDRQHRAAFHHLRIQSRRWQATPRR